MAHSPSTPPHPKKTAPNSRMEYSRIRCHIIVRKRYKDEQKGCHKGSKGTAELLYIDQHILNESKARRKNLAMAWIDNKKAYDMVPLSQDVQNITWSHKLHRKDHANLERGADSRRNKLSWNKDPKRDFPRRCTVTLIIHNSLYATKPNTQKTRSRIKT